LVMTDPQVHYIEYPLPPKVRCFKCAKCFGDEGVGKIKGEYSDLPYLSKHLKKYHPGDTISHRCSKCNYKSKGKYPLYYKDVKAHFIKCHVSLAVVAAGPSTRGSLVTAGPSTRSTTSSTTVRSKTVAKSAAPTTTTREARRSGEAATTRKSPRSATVSKPRVVSVEIVKLPNAAKPARAPSHPPQRTSPEAGGSRPSVEKIKCGEGALKKLSTNKDLPVSFRTQRATSVPVEDEEGTPFQPGGMGRLSLRRNWLTKPPPITTSSEGVVMRSGRSTSAPVEKNAMDARLSALDRPSSRMAGNLTSPIAEGLNNIMDQWRKTPPAMLPSLLPGGTQGSPSGSPGEKLISFSPATSLPTTLTTCTVTTTCGSSITSTGFTGGAGRKITPPSCLPQKNILPTIGEEKTSPSPINLGILKQLNGRRNVLTWTSPLIQPRPTTPEPERGQEERRQKGAASTTPIVEGDKQWGDQWTVSVGRRVRRQQKHDRSPSNSESPPTAGPSRSPRIAPLSALIATSTNQHDKCLSVSRMNDNRFVLLDTREV
ncbi:hypothetical protein ALC57_13275, partial [Trachymyrmex cornetzi]